MSEDQAGRPRKRSQSLRLGGLLAGAAVSIAGCSEQPATQWEPSVSTYDSVAGCQGGGYTADECALAFDQANTDRVLNAPRYMEQSLCESAYGAGRCVGTINEAGQNVFMPLLAGFAISRLANSNISGGALYRQPYREQEYASSSSGGGGGYSGWSSNSDGNRTAAQRSVLSRGGFGRSYGFRGG